MPIEPSSAPLSKPTTRWYDSTFLGAVLTLLIWPVGVYALLRNRRLGGFGKVFVIGAMSCILFVGIVAAAGGAFLMFRANGGWRQAWHFNTEPRTAKPVLSQNNTPSNVDLNPHDGPVDDKSLGDNSDSTPKLVRSAVSRKASDLHAQPALISDDLPVAPTLVAARRELAQTDPSRIPPVNSPPPPKEEPRPDNPPSDENALLQQLLDDARRREAEKRAQGGAPLPPPNSPPQLSQPAPRESTDLNAQAADLVARVRSLQDSKRQQLEQSEKLLEDYRNAAAVDPQLQTMELSFRDYLRRKYNDDQFDERRFDEYFTDDYLRRYNQQILKQQDAVLAGAKSLQESDALIRQESARLENVAADLNANLRAAGRAPVALPADPAVDGRLQSLRSRLATLAERPITMTDIRQTIGARASRRPEVVLTIPQIPVQPPVTVQPPVGIQPPIAIQPPLAAPGVTAGDLIGTWVRSDGKVFWDIGPRGGIFARAKDVQQNLLWTYDDRTAQLSVNHHGVLQQFTLVRENGGLVLRGGNVGGGSPLIFTKAKP